MGGDAVDKARELGAEHGRRDAEAWLDAEEPEEIAARYELPEPKLSWETNPDGYTSGNLEDDCGLSALEDTIPNEDGSVFRATFRRCGKTTTVIASCVGNVWYIAGSVMVKGPRTYGSLCAFFSRVEVLEITRYSYVK